jgi:hypothetical protein
MATITPNYQLAAGNNNAGGLTALTSITDTNSVPFVMPRGKGSRNRGVKRDRLNSTQATVGKDSITWLFTAMTLDQYNLLLTTYEGLVTVKISLTSTTYANYNAVMVVPDEEDLEYVRWINFLNWGAGNPGYRDVEVLLRKLEAL